MLQSPAPSSLSLAQHPPKAAKPPPPIYPNRIAFSPGNQSWDGDWKTRREAPWDWSTRQWRRLSSADERIFLRIYDGSGLVLTPPFSLDSFGETTPLCGEMTRGGIWGKLPFSDGELMGEILCI